MAPPRRRRNNNNNNNNNNHRSHDGSSEHNGTTTKKGSNISSTKSNDPKQRMKPTRRPWQKIPLVLSVVVVVVAIVILWQQRSAANTVVSSSDSTTAKDTLASLSKVSERVDTTPTPKETRKRKRQKRSNQNDNNIGITPIGADYQLLEALPHDSSAFTQGLVYIDGIMYEGTGLHGMSELRRVEIPTGKVIQRHVLDRTYFGEGIAYYPTRKDDNDGDRGRLLQLTWQEQKAFVYDASTFDVLQDFSFTTTTNEGWGVTYNPLDHTFIVSDGSEWLHIWDATTMQELRKVNTTMRIGGIDNGQSVQIIPVKHLNELEFDPHDGTVLANIWYRDVIVRIDPTTGHVVRIYDFSKLHTNRQPGEDCFNGIAVIADRPGELYVTGKKWPAMYRVKLLL